MEVDQEGRQANATAPAASGGGGSGYIMIPVRDSEEFVTVSKDELPPDANDIIDILKAEFAPLDIWLQFAVWFKLINRIFTFAQH